MVLYRLTETLCASSAFSASLRFLRCVQILPQRRRERGGRAEKNRFNLLMKYQPEFDRKKRIERSSGLLYDPLQFQHTGGQRK